ncbi:hypothetical protein [Candidatus Nanohalovita haloferacivicina]|uniref:hypothetical protein n=1 Tax=Candidatus Nanohalovita haloferacivicina TaxID=2978046 RepID=UPI00325FB493|nr:hypothetical protein HBNXNv_0700 [Candidatus Nanohalobia archaeon BNXNv]
MAITGGTSLQVALETFIYTPIRQPELLPTLLPIIIGGIVIELYFGRFTHEELGWNTAVGNAIIWITTGANLLINSNLSAGEEKAAYSLIGIGAIVGYMDFYHKWPDTIAFIVSSSGIVYTLAYITVIFVKTDLGVTPDTLRGAAVFFLAVQILFKLFQGFETTADSGGSEVSFE